MLCSMTGGNPLSSMMLQCMLAVIIGTETLSIESKLPSGIQLPCLSMATNVLLGAS